MATNGLEVNNFTTNNIANKKAANAAAKAAGTGTNPTSQLDKDAFMKLLLTELRYQDPTSPMDTEKMLSQTSQLAALETQENTNQMMKKLADQLKSSTNMYAVGVLGKMAKISDSSLLLDDNSPSVKFSSFFDDAAVGGKISIKDRNGNVVRTMQFNKLKSGVNEFEWDGKDNSGTRLKAGEYTVEIAYADENGKTKTAGTGKYMVEGIKFVDGEAKIKVGGQYISINKVKEFTEPTAKKANG
jgi:flagellar hook capping protein